MDSKPLRILLLAALSALALKAQLLAPDHDHQWWVGSKLVTAPFTYPLKVGVEDIPTRKGAEQTFPKGTRNLWCADQALWAYAVVQTPKDPKGDMRMQPWGGGWRTVATWEGEKDGCPDRLYPLSDGWYLGLREQGFLHEKKVGIAAVFRANARERLELQEIVELALDDLPSMVLALGRPKPNPAWGVPARNLTGDVKVLPWEDGLVLAHYWTGALWVLDGKGRLRHTLNPMGLRRVDFKRGIEVAVKTIQPTRDGRLLICTRPAHSVKSIPILFDIMLTTEHMQNPAKHKKAEQELLDSIREFPDVEWYECEPRTGAFRRVPTPHGAPDKLERPQDALFYTFTFRPDGSLESTVKPR